MRTQRRPIPDEPDVPKGIYKAALTMCAPWRRMIPDFVHAPVRACCYRPRDETVGIIAKHLDSCGRDSKLCGTLPTIPGRLSNEKRRPGDLKARYPSQVPKLNSAQRPFVPGDSLRCIGHRKHHGYYRRASFHCQCRLTATSAP